MSRHDHARLGRAMIAIVLLTSMLLVCSMGVCATKETKSTFESTGTTAPVKIGGSQEVQSAGQGSEADLTTAEVQEEEPSTEKESDAMSHESVTANRYLGVSVQSTPSYAVIAAYLHEPSTDDSTDPEKAEPVDGTQPAESGTMEDLTTVKMPPPQSTSKTLTYSSTKNPSKSLA